MEITSFDTQIHSDEFAIEYEEYLTFLSEQWEEPEEWKNSIWPLSQAAKTSPFHGEDRSSILLGITIWPLGQAAKTPASHTGDRGFDPRRSCHARNLICCDYNAY